MATATSCGEDGRFEELRKKAEALIGDQSVRGFDSPPDILDLIQELRLHQAELAIQNEELERARQEYADLHQVYYSLYEFAPCGYLTLSSKGIVTRANLMAVNLLGATRDLLYRTGFHRFFDEPGAHRFFEARRAFVETGEKQTFELSTEAEDSTRRWFQASVEGDLDAEGEVAEWRIVLLDISAKKRVEEALQQREASLRAVMASITDGLVICSKDRVVQYMNPAMVRHVGRDATGERCHEAFFGAKTVCNGCALDRVLRGQAVEIEVEPLNHRTFEVYCTPMPSPDGTRQLSVFRDVTERRVMEAQLLHSQKMESIGTLTGGIAHEFNNLLATIMGFTELAMEDAQSEVSVLDNLNMVMDHGRRARDLVKQLLIFGRRFQPKMETIDLNVELRSVLDVIKVTLPRMITVSSDLEEPLALISGDGNQLRHVFLNLATNARDAMPDGGVLHFRSARVGLGVRNKIGATPGIYVCFEVSDTGTGIDPGIKAEVFDPFFTTKEVGSGTGLGLSTVYSIVKAHRGYVDFLTEVGRGTTFRLFFPAMDSTEIHERARPAQDDTGADPSPLPGAIPGAHVLIADDEPDVRELLSEALHRQGYRVSRVGTGKQAIDVLLETGEEIDLVVLDWGMPEMGGARCLEEARRLGISVKFLVSSGYANEVMREVTERYDVSDVLSKPYTLRTFLEAVARALKPPDDESCTRDRPIPS